MTKIIFGILSPADQWDRPRVSGDMPPPVFGMTFTKFAKEKAFMFGGKTPNGDSSTLRLATVVEYHVVSLC